MAVVTIGSTTACTETEVLTAALVIGAAVVAPTPTDHYRPIGRGHYPRDRWDRDNRGPGRGPGRGNGGHGGGHGGGGYDRGGRDDRGGRGAPRDHRGPRRNTFALTTKAVAPAEFVSDDARVIKIADKYEITDYAATYIARAVILAEQKSLAGVQELGLTKRDLQKVYQGKELETSKIEVLSEKLVLSRGETQRLLKEMSEDIQVEKAARGL